MGSGTLDSSVTPIPDVIAEDLRVLGLVGVRAAKPLAGGRGGRTWRVDAPAGSFVLHRRAGDKEGISSARVAREHRCTALAHAVGVGPEAIAVDAARGLLLTRWIPGRALTGPALRRPDSLDRVGVLLRTLHTAALPRHRVRPAEDRRRYVSAALAVPHPLTVLLESTREALDDLSDALNLTVPHDVLVHGDALPGNIIGGAHAVALVDYEYAGRGDAGFDLGNLAASASLDHVARRRLVRAYCADDEAAQRARLDVRTRAWARVAQGAWIAWVVAGAEPGAQTPTWRRWAERASADLSAAHRRGEIRSLTRDVVEA